MVEQMVRPTTPPNTPLADREAETPLSPRLSAALGFFRTWQASDAFTDPDTLHAHKQLSAAQTDTLRAVLTHGAGDPVRELSRRLRLSTRSLEARLTELAARLQNLSEAVPTPPPDSARAESNPEGRAPEKKAGVVYPVYPGDPENQEDQGTRGRSPRRAGRAGTSRAAASLKGAAAQKQSLPVRTGLLPGGTRRGGAVAALAPRPPSQAGGAPAVQTSADTARPRQNTRGTTRGAPPISEKAPSSPSLPRKKASGPRPAESVAPRRRSEPAPSQFTADTEPFELQTPARSNPAPAPTLALTLGESPDAALRLAQQPSPSTIFPEPQAPEPQAPEPSLTPASLTDPVAPAGRRGAENTPTPPHHETEVPARPSAPRRTSVISRFVLKGEGEELHVLDRGAAGEALFSPRKVAIFFEPSLAQASFPDAEPYRAPPTEFALPPLPDLSPLPSLDPAALTELHPARDIIAWLSPAQAVRAQGETLWQGEPFGPLREYLQFERNYAALVSAQHFSGLLEGERQDHAARQAALAHSADELTARAQRAETELQSRLEMTTLLPPPEAADLRVQEALARAEQREIEIRAALDLSERQREASEMKAAEVSVQLEALQTRLKAPSRAVLPESQLQGYKDYVRRLEADNTLLESQLRVAQDALDAPEAVSAVSGVRFERRISHFKSRLMLRYKLAVPREEVLGWQSQLSSFPTVGRLKDGSPVKIIAYKGVPIYAVVSEEGGASVLTTAYTQEMFEQMKI